ncbi:MAG TPA: hypothetical protein VFO77_03335 [Actinoplanes sp.]|nr:hypothetical protein [Actinoplanes sp.]
MTATRRTLLLGGAASTGLLLLNVIVLTGWLAPLRAVIGFPIAAVLPGALALRALRITRRTGWDWLLLAVTFSLAALLVLGVTLGLLPGPALSPAGCLVGLDLLVAALAAAAALRERHRPAGSAPSARADPAGAAAVRSIAADLLGAAAAPGIAAVLLGVAAVVLVVVGADRLNSGGTWVPTAAGLGTAAAALTASVLAGRRHRVTAAATGIYLVALAVLLATSLRGLGVTGHDIKIEYRVLLDTLAADSWHPGGIFVGYNSCLSITVLPAFVSRLLGLAAIDVYRVCFQVLFATVPVGVFLLARRRLPTGSAVCAAGLFIAFPAFVNDMPMLNRQEIALIFFVALLGAVFDVHSPRGQRAIVFGVAAAGLTVSHYTSTYLTAAVLLTAWALRWLRSRRLPLPGWRTAQSPERIFGLGRGAVAVSLMALAWAVASGSAATFADGLTQAATAVLHRASVSSDSSRYSLISADGRPPTDGEALTGYVDAIRRADPMPDTATVPAACAPRLLPSDTLTSTTAGAALSRAGVAPHRLNDVSRDAAVLLFQGGSVVGCAVLGWRRRREGCEALACLAGGAIVLLAVSVVAPQLTDSYGLLRLFQQLLVLLAPLVVLGLNLAVRPLRRTGPAVATAVTVGCLLTTSGVVPQLVGGYVPQLNLNNAGPYFHAYYADDSDLRVAAWIRRHLSPGSYLVADSRDTANLRSMTHLYPQEGLAPGGIPGDAYVGLTTVGENAEVAMAVAIVGERVLRYTFPVSCVSAGRPLVHETPQHRLYGPVVSP